MYSWFTKRTEVFYSKLVDDYRKGLSTRPTLGIASVLAGHKQEIPWNLDFKVTETLSRGLADQLAGQWAGI